MQNKRLMSGAWCKISVAIKSLGKVFQLFQTELMWGQAPISCNIEIAPYFRR